MGSAGWGGVWRRASQAGLLSAAPAAPVAAPPSSPRPGLRVRPGDSWRRRGRGHLALGLGPGPGRAVGGEEPGGGRGVGGRGGGRGGGAVHAGRAGARRGLGTGVPRPRVPGRLQAGGGGVEVALKARRRVGEVAGVGLPPRVHRAAAARICARQVSVLASSGPAPGGGHRRDPTGGRRLGPGRPPGNAPCCAGSAPTLSRERTPGVQGLDPLPGESRAWLQHQNEFSEAISCL